MIIDNKKIEAIKERQKQQMLQEQMTKTIMNAEIEKKKMKFLLIV